MLMRWERGDRTGLNYKPARRSWHALGLAIDVETRVKGYPAYRELMRFLGVRVGEDFGDKGHFDVPIPGQEPPDVLSYV